MIKNNIKSFAVALIILYLSVSESNTLKAPSFLNIPNIDKVVHFGMYFTFMFVIILEHKLFTGKKKKYSSIRPGPVYIWNSYGIASEVFY